MKKFQLNFGFLHSNDDVIFPSCSIGDGGDTDDGRLHEISTPGTICIENMIRIPIESRQAFKITKTIICQIKFHKEFDDSEKHLDTATVKAYETFLNDEILTDCIILCENGKSVKVHKVMLAAHSSIFYSMLQNSNEINMKNVQHNIVMEMKRFLYCRKINGSEYILLEMLKLADEYEINDLKKFSEHQLMRGVTIQTAVERAILAHVNKATILKNFILEYICNRWNTIKENEVNLAMLDEYPLMLREIINKFALRDNKKNNENF
ncbi:speckle-type POZ protein B-like, partial [Chironomus tepperi]|uniref:speckle-type POZ protein B-like n=1 Tax=Chironomus tepperi TaxID=113505 RepID=UPI00391F6059